MTSFHRPPPPPKPLGRLRDLLRRGAPLLLGAMLLGAPAAMAQPFAPPGLQRDAGGYARELVRRFPAGAPTAQRGQAETRAREAEVRGDWAAAAEAWEQRLGMPDAKPEFWLALARAQLARTPANPTRALQAAWQNFTAVETGPAEVPALQLMA